MAPSAGAIGRDARRTPLRTTPPRRARLVTRGGMWHNGSRTPTYRPFGRHTPFPVPNPGDPNPKAEESDGGGFATRTGHHLGTDGGARLSAPAGVHRARPH